MPFPANPFGAEVEKKSEEKEKEDDKTPWATVAIGESWLVPDYFNRNPYLAATTHGRRTGKKFVAKREGYGMRITRVEPFKPEASYDPSHKRWI